MSSPAGIALAWRTLPPLVLPADALVEERAMVQRLFHACGGSSAWFAGAVWPQMLLWEAWVSGLTVDPAPGAPSCLRCVLAAAAAAAEASAFIAPDPRDEPEVRLVAAAGMALASARHWSRIAQVRTAQGVGWSPVQESLRAWRARHPEPHFLALSPAARADDPWGRAAAALVARGVWRAQGRIGRLLTLATGWALLWPLAGRDLLRALADEGGEHLQLEDVLAGLAEWGYRPASPEPSPVQSFVHADGRALMVLPVTAALLCRVGLEHGRVQCALRPDAC